MKVFISQPMKGKTNEEIEKEREEITQFVIDRFPQEKVEILDSFFKNAPHDANPLWFLGESIKLLSQADYIVLAKGWECARGCKIERECALQYGIGIFVYNGD